MKILLIHNFYQYWGGEDSYIISLEKLLKDKDNEVYLYKKDSKNIKTFWDKIKAGVGLFWNREVEKELSQMIKKQRPDIAHFNNIYPLIGPTAYRICKKYNIPIIQHVHNYRFMCPKGTLFKQGTICELCVARKLPFYSVIFGCYHQSRLASLFFSLSFFFHRLINTFQLIDRFIFPSEFTRSYYIKNLVILITKTHIIPNFIEIFDKTIKKDKRLSQKEYFLYVGRLSEEKGIIKLLDLFKELQTKKLVVIGDGPLKNQVDLYKKYKNIEVKGFLDKKSTYNYMKNCIALVIPSLWYEVLPLVYIEALMNRIPVLLPNNNNFLQISKGNTFTFFYKNGDLKDLTRRIGIVEKTRFGLQNRSNKKYEINYTSEIHYQRLKNIYEELMINFS